ATARRQPGKPAPHRLIVWRKAAGPRTYTASDCPERPLVTVTQHGLRHRGRSGHASVRSLASYTRVSTEATRSCTDGRPGLVLQGLVRPGGEEQWPQSGTVD